MTTGSLQSKPTIRSRHHLKLLALGSLLLTGVSNAALAQVWDGSSSSDWFVGDNWDGGVVPDGTADVIVDDVTTNAPVVENVLGNGPGQAQEISIGNNDTGTLAIQDGGRVESSQGFIGRNVGSNGAVTVAGAGSTWDSSAELRVGHGGTGSLTIQDGGRVENTFGNIANFGGSTGAVTVSGPGSIWDNSAELRVGRQGTGTLTVMDGGRVENSQGFIGRDAGSNGAVTVTGVGSTWDNSSFLRLGQNAGATGTLNIGAAAGDGAAAPGTVNATSIQFGDGTGTLVFNHSDTTGTYSFTEDLASVGGGTHTIAHHAGWTNYTGNGSAFAGTTNVDGGIFAVNGSLGGQVNVLGGGTLAGTGTLGGLVMVNDGGTIAPGNSIGTINVTDITFDPGSVYAVEVDAAGNSDLINASGTATIDGGTVAVSGTPGDGNTYTILTAADPLTAGDTFDDVTGNTLFITYALEYDPNNVYLTTDVGSFCNEAGSPNQKEVACDGLDSLPLGNDIAQAVLALTTRQEARAAYDALSGQIQSSVKSAVLDNSQHAVMAINERMHGTFADGGEQSSVAAFGDLASDGNNGFWFTGYGSWADTGSNANTAQMDNELGGVVFGIDRQFSDTWQFGVLGGYSESDVAQDALNSSAQADTWSLGLYGGAEAGANVLSFGAIYNWHDIDTARTVRFPGVNQSLSASYDAQSWQLFAEAGRQVQLDRVMLEPFAGISYISLDTDGFSETGGTAALTAGADTNSTTFTTLGARASMQVTNEIDAHAMVGWRHAFGDTEGTTAFTLAGSNPFTVTGAPIAEDAFVTELGFEANISDNSFLGASYNGQYGDGTTGHGFNANFRVRF